MDKVRGMAKKANLTVYGPTKRCKRGHLAPRYVSTGNCVECHAEREQVWKPSAPPIIPREGVVVLRNVQVPRKYLNAIRQLIDAYMAAEGLLPGPPPEVLEFKSDSPPVARGPD